MLSIILLNILLTFKEENQCECLIRPILGIHTYKYILQIKSKTNFILAIALASPANLF